jgi:predicted esterase
MTSRITTAVICLSFALSACEGDAGSARDADAEPDGEDAPLDAADAVDAVDEPAADTVDDTIEDVPGEDTADDAVDVAEDAGDDAVEPPRVVSCADPPPPGADLPAPLPVYAGDCPTLEPGRNTITSSGSERSFLLVLPADHDPSEPLPVVFLWHWLGGDAEDFLDKGEVQAAADEMRFIAVAPDSKDDVVAKWPFLLLDSAPRLEEEAVFFDDMLACVADQLAVNASCVSTVGVSAGALWTSQLSQLRSERLASFMSLSGGVGTPGDLVNPVHPWNGAAHAMPALVLWGGPTDFCGVTFSTTSHNLENGLTAGGHFILECVHNCAHAQPPMDPPAGESAFAALWTFVLDHPYWLRDGESPYQATGLPGVYPEWCAVGAGNATIRTGECESGPLGDCF